MSLDDSFKIMVVPIDANISYSNNTPFKELGLPTRDDNGETAYRIHFPKTGPKYQQTEPNQVIQEYLLHKFAEKINPVLIKEFGEGSDAYFHYYKEPRFSLRGKGTLYNGDTTQNTIRTRIRNFMEENLNLFQEALDEFNSNPIDIETLKVRHDIKQKFIQRFNPIEIIINDDLSFNLIFTNEQTAVNFQKLAITAIRMNKAENGTPQSHEEEYHTTKPKNLLRDETNERKYPDQIQRKKFNTRAKNAVGNIDKIILGRVFKGIDDKGSSTKNPVQKGDNGTSILKLSKEAAEAISKVKNMTLFDAFGFVQSFYKDRTPVELTMK